VAANGGALAALVGAVLGAPVLALGAVVAAVPLHAAKTIAAVAASAATRGDHILDRDMLLCSSSYCPSPGPFCLPVRRHGAGRDLTRPEGLRRCRED
jgi:hypothetical protein